MIRKLKYLLSLTALSLLIHLDSAAQCSMCRASMENSISMDSEQFSAGLNMGILYLFIMPYLLFGIIAYMWYRASKKNVSKIKIKFRP